MPFASLRAFVAELEKKGELVRVKTPVSARLEITEITDRVVKRGGPALLFENVTGADYPVAINLFGKAERMAFALGVNDVNEIARRIEEMLDLEAAASKRGLLSKLSLLPKLLEAASFPPRHVKSGPVQEEVREGGDVDLARLPVLWCWPDDGGPFITLPLVITKDPVTGQRNMGMYRMQVFDRNTTGMHWHRHKVGAAHFRKAKELGRRLEAAVALGGDPALTYAATAPLPQAIDEFLFTDFLRGRPVELIPAKTVDLEVPADADIVLEGYVDPAEEPRMEGPFGDHTGFYSLADYYPVFHVTAMTTRRDAIYPATIVGRPPMEDYWLGHATERIFGPLARLLLPEIVDYHMPPEGVFHNLVFVSIDKQYPGHAFKVAQGMLGIGLLMLAKTIVVLDRDVNVQDATEAWWVALNNIDPERDVKFTFGPADVLDHASRAFTYGSKMIIDATRKWPEEGFTREWPERIRMDEKTKKFVDERWGEYGIRL